VHLAESFREEFCGTGEVAINTPFSGGFISNAHYWRKGIPWIQIEVNRALYEPEITPTYRPAAIEEQIAELRHKIWQILTRFWAGIAVEALMEESSRS
jgi:formiminoglutamase